MRRDRHAYRPLARLQRIDGAVWRPARAVTCQSRTVARASRMHAEITGAHTPVAAGKYCSRHVGIQERVGEGGFCFFLRAKSLSDTFYNFCDEERQ